jgi:hypothetical protein
LKLELFYFLCCDSNEKYNWHYGMWVECITLIAHSCILKPVDKFCTCVTDISICNLPF